MTIKQFIEKAVEGGWSKSTMPILHMPGYPDAVAYALLAPEAWKAVGKVEGWHDKFDGDVSGLRYMSMEPWLVNMHRMIDALADGKTIEEFLATL